MAFRLGPAGEIRFYPIEGFPQTFLLLDICSGVVSSSAITRREKKKLVTDGLFAVLARYVVISGLPPYFKFNEAGIQFLV